MTDYINILKEQVEEGRRSGLSSSHEPSSTRQSIQKKKLIPLENPESNDSSNQTKSNNEKNTGTKLQQLNKPIYKEVSTEPEQVDNTKNRPQLSTMSTDPISPGINEDDQNELSNTQSGGALWDAPKEFQDIRSSMKKLPQPQQLQTGNKPCLFDLVMQPPKKELQPTLFTYFDKLMQMGEV